ncbi:hypothetical protein [Halobacillus salinus]|nr:hypothetical protein [Halobacillus salinus]
MKKIIYAVQLILIPMALVLMRVIEEVIRGSLSFETISEIFPVLIIYFFVSNIAWFFMEEKLSVAIAKDKEKMNRQS